ncbi:MAG: endolytic transglycosylase MltG [Bacteroidota bacterium]
MFSHYKNNRNRFLFGDLIGVFLPCLTLLIIAMALYRVHWIASLPVIDLKGKPSAYLFIRTGSDFREVQRLLGSSGLTDHVSDFTWLAHRKKYSEKIKPGRYKIVDGMSNNDLLNMLRSGKQEPVRITFQNIRTPEDLAGKIGKSLETDSSQLIRFFGDSSFLQQFGLTEETLFIYFIPDTYEFLWNTSGVGLFRRMEREFRKFWNEDRRRQADSLRLTIPEVVTLASIVEKETNKNDEKSRIAGVYFNRLQKHIPLQADPTVIFAWKDYTIRRVLNKHLQIISPYNTYHFAGLPPGPICIPSVASVNAVLCPEHHDFIYFCAKADLSGYHAFARTLSEHSMNANKYQQALNGLNIKR